MACLLCASPLYGQKNLLFFSTEQGFYKSPVSLEISSLNGDSVHYTLDGSLPDYNSTLVSGSIELGFTDSSPNIYSEIPTSPKQSDIDYKAWEPPGGPVDKVHVIRCASFRDGSRTSLVYTRTYFVDENIGNKYSTPIISLLTDSANLFGAEIGIYLPGNKYDSDNSNWTGNYFQKGTNWERPVHLEYFSENGELELSQDAGIRIHGGKTRHAAQKTLRVYARDEYGEDDFNFKLLPQKEVSKYKRFLLRTSMGSWQGETIIADVLAHELVRDLDVEIMDYQPVIVFLNGEYWGIHTLRDRVGERFIEYTFGIDRDSVDMINANISLVDAGSNEHYLRLAEFIDLNDLSDQNNFEYVKTQMDISSFVDYVIAEMFFSNSDWPGNNQKLWRPQTPDGKWRWIFTDLDGAYDPEAPNIFKHAMAKEGEMEWQSEPVSSFLLRNLLKNSQFTSLFIARFAEILNEEFTHEKIFHKINGIKTLYEEEMPRHISRWKYPASLSSWENDMEDYLLDFLIARPCEVTRQVISYFKLEEFGFSCESHDELEKHIIVAPNPNDGSFFIWNDSERSMLAHMVISDVSGRIVYVEENVLLESQIKKPYDFPEFSAGLYYLSLVSAQQSVVKPIVIY